MKKDDPLSCCDQNQDWQLDTPNFAAKNMVKPQSVRARVCRFGSYFGIKPHKLANGRLAWPNVRVEVQS